MPEHVTIDRHLYLTEDGCRVVEENDPAARWLHWTPGQSIAKHEFERLCKPKTPPPEAKKRVPAANKARKPAASK